MNQSRLPSGCRLAISEHREEVVRGVARREREGERDAVRSPDIIIGEAYERHCKENHQADYEVCPNSLCEAAYALERLYYPLYELVVVGLEMSGAVKQIAQGIAEEAG